MVKLMTFYKFLCTYLYCYYCKQPGTQGKQEMLESVKLLSEMRFTLYGSSGTADFYNEHGIKVHIPLPTSSRNTATHNTLIWSGEQ